MKNWMVILLGLLAVDFAHASIENIKVATVDMQKAIQTTETGKKARADLELAFNKRKKELQDEEADLKKMQEDFQKKQAVMNTAAREKKQAELQQRFMKYQDLLQRSQTEIQSKEQEMSRPIIEKLRKIIGDIAKKKEYALVLEKNENVVLFSLEKDDITPEVITQFNQEYKK